MDVLTMEATVMLRAAEVAGPNEGIGRHMRAEARMSEPTREELLALIALMRGELWSQWESNHAEHCGKEPPLHDGECYWPLPGVLEDSQ